MITLLIKTFRISALGLLFFPGSSVLGQNSLERYIDFGLSNNLVLQQKNIGLEKAILSLKTAGYMFLPTSVVKGDYQSGMGGRSIDLPIGDLMNPVYNTLNQLTASNNFQQISNVETYFFPQNFYDLKLRTSMPLIHNDLIINRQIEKLKVELQSSDVEIYRQELIRSIQVAYFNYLSAAKSVEIYKNAMVLAEEGKRTNERLLRNGLSVPAYLMRSESELSGLQASLTTAVNQTENARQYFNFLINTAPDAAIDTTQLPQPDLSLLKNLLAEQPGISGREELKALNTSVRVAERILQMNKSWWYPRVNAFADFGSQASNWKFDSKSTYYFVGVQMEVPVFASGQNKQKIRQSSLDLKHQQLTRTYTENRILLGAKVAGNNLRSAYSTYEAAMAGEKAASEYHRMVWTGYKEGTFTFLETLDARNQLTTLTLKRIISYYNLMAAIADYKREISNNTPTQ